MVDCCVLSIEILKSRSHAIHSWRDTFPSADEQTSFTASRTASRWSIISCYNFATNEYAKTAKNNSIFVSIESNTPTDN